MGLMDQRRWSGDWSLSSVLTSEWGRNKEINNTFFFFTFLIIKIGEAGGGYVDTVVEDIDDVAQGSVLIGWRVSFLWNLSFFFCLLFLFLYF